MSTSIDACDSSRIDVAPPPLEAGDHLDQKTFHARYEAMPQGTRAELIGGVVYMASAMKLPHARFQRRISVWLGDYEDATPGVEGGDSPSTILGDDSEPQPDACLFIRPELGGQIRIGKDEYIRGAPELVVEVASSTESYDLHAKKRDYERAGVREYVVIAVRQRKVFWFVLRDGSFEPMPPDAEGFYRSQVFPGLWLDPDALLRLDGKRMREVLGQGIGTAEHAEFVKGLSG
jgi:Uma2 family endonuclease